MYVEIKVDTSRVRATDTGLLGCQVPRVTVVSRILRVSTLSLKLIIQVRSGYGYGTSRSLSS